MKITDVIRGVLDLVDQASAEPEQATTEPIEVVADVMVDQPNELAIIQQLAGMPIESEYANEPREIVAPTGAAFPGGDDMHNRKNPADIRSNATSMYPAYQASGR
jgi:hypothetical protein